MTSAPPDTHSTRRAVGSWPENLPLPWCSSPCSNLPVAPGSQKALFSSEKSSWAQGLLRTGWRGDGKAVCHMGPRDSWPYLQRCQHRLAQIHVLCIRLEQRKYVFVLDGFREARALNSKAPLGIFLLDIFGNDKMFPKGPARDQPNES